MQIKESLEFSAAEATEAHAWNLLTYPLPLAFVSGTESLDSDKPEFESHVRS